MFWAKLSLIKAIPDVSGIKIILEPKINFWKWIKPKSLTKVKTVFFMIFPWTEKNVLTSMATFPWLVLLDFFMGIRGHPKVSKMVSFALIQFELKNLEPKPYRPKKIKKFDFSRYGIKYPICERVNLVREFYSLMLLYEHWI